MDRICLYFYLMPILLVILGSSTQAFQGPAPLSHTDTAIINDWYRGAFLSMKGDLKRSDDFVNKAWKMAIDIGYDQGIADGYYYTGCIYEQKGALDIAGRYFEKAISLYLQGQFMDNLPDSYRRLGEIYIHDGRYYTGLQNFLNGLRVADEQGNRIDQVRLSIQLANYHNTISRDYKEAIAILRDAERWTNAVGYTHALGPIYLQYSISYGKQQDYTGALHYTDLARRAFVEASDNKNLLETLLTEGDVYGRMHDEGRLANILEEAEPLIDSIGDDRLTSRFQLLYATELYFLGDYNTALDTCEALYAQLKSAAQQSDRLRVRLLHAKILFATGDLRSADSLIGDYAYVKDSLYAAQYVGQGMEMSENYKLEKFERQIKEQELLLSNTRYQRYGLITGIVVLLTILGILYFHFREKDKLAHRVALQNAEISVQNEILKQANKQNELLLREIHHRVKNNLQIINSLLSLQSRKTTNREVITMMQESSSRINSIALIHNKLYQQQSINRLNIQDYIEQLGAHLLSIYNVGNKRVQFHVEANDVSLDIDTAISVGLILTELTTNSLKYAFVGREAGEIHVDVSYKGDRDYELVFKDNGVGIPETKRKQTNETLGFRLIHSLTRQLAGMVHYTFDEFSMYNIRFKGQA
ncbi:sensor histidine kinase [Parapedobacter pyrenivorans]|uniref:sensor histidine kinase n=1 Tax=Parapedobacter pyrenivorans TaxID=1305674 RepID=UPI0033427773